MLKKEIRNTLFAKIKAIKHWDNEHLCFPDQNIYVLDVSVRDSASLTSTDQGRKLEVPAGQRSTGCAFRSEPDMSQGFAMQCQPGASANLARSLNNTNQDGKTTGAEGKWLARSGATVLGAVSNPRTMLLCRAVWVTVVKVLCQLAGKTSVICKSPPPSSCLVQTQ